MCRLILLFVVTYVVSVCNSTVDDFYDAATITPSKTPNDNDIICQGNEMYSIDHYSHAVKGGRLKFHIIPATWTQARLRCQLEGSLLASPVDEELLESMLEVMQRAGLCRVFTGISALPSLYASGNYATVDGVPLEQISLKWLSGEPDNFNDQERCLAMSSQGGMADVSCTRVLPYFCYKEIIPSRFYKCGARDNGYEYEMRTDSCYKTHRFGKNWTDAYSTCAGDGGHLVIINSDREAQVLKEIMAKYPPAILRSSENHKNYFHIGFSDWSGYGAVWLTIQGQTLKDAGYEKWAPEEPNSISTSVELCGSMTRDATLNDIECWQNMAFICEKLPSVK